MELIASNSVKANVVEESIADATEVSQELTEEEEVIQKTPSSFDRSVEPDLGPDPVVVPPEVWKEELANGIHIYGISYDELPLLNYSLVLKGGHLLDKPELAGTADLVAALTSMHLVGNIPPAQVKSKLSGIEARWESKEVRMPEFEIPTNPDQSQIFFVDVPGARSGFYANDLFGTFQASSSVRSNATLESVEIFREEMNKYREGIRQEDQDFTKDALLKSNAREFETLWALQRMLETISMYDLPFDYITKQQEVTKSMTQSSHKALAQKYITADHMYYVVVGDAATQLKALNSLGLGSPELVA